MVILDETYAEFAEQNSMVEDLASTPNLIILRTLSKSYAFAGMRMGCLLCADQDFVTLVKTKALDAYPLPRMSIEAAFHVMSPDVKQVAEENIQKILSERRRMEAELIQSEHIEHVFPSDANFLLIKMKHAKAFCDYAAENNLIIRDFSRKKGTEDCLRISMGTQKENDLVLNLLKNFNP